MNTCKIKKNKEFPGDLLLGFLCIRLESDKSVLNDDAKIHVLKHINGIFRVKYLCMRYYLTLLCRNELRNENKCLDRSQVNIKRGCSVCMGTLRFKLRIVCSFIFESETHRLSC